MKGWWHGKLEAEDDTPSLLRGVMKPGPKGPLSHRLERLIHLELADLAQNGQYFDPDFMEWKWPWNATGSGGGAPSKKLSPVRRQGIPCSDCTYRLDFSFLFVLIGVAGSRMHKEIFSFARIEKGPCKGKEWELVVQPVFEKWGKLFCLL